MVRSLADRTFQLRPWRAVRGDREKVLDGKQALADALADAAEAAAAASGTAGGAGASGALAERLPLREAGRRWVPPLVYSNSK